MIAPLLQHRGYIWRTAWAEVRTRYAGSGLGVVWNILQPLSLILIFTIIFTSLMPHGGVAGDGREINYTVYLCAALLPWISFSECINRGTAAFVTHAVYLRKLPIPEQVFVAQAALASLINLAIAFVVLLAVALIMGHTPTWHWALLPIPMALLTAMGFGLGLMLGTLNAFIRDVGQAVPIMLQIGFWLYPIAYFEAALPQGIRDALKYNPVYPFLTSIRELFVWGHVPAWSAWGLMLMWTVIFAALGSLVLSRLRSELRDVI